MQCQSKKAFNAKLSIALEEADEASFWLEVIEDLRLVEYSKMSLILQESAALAKILVLQEEQLPRN